MPFLEPTQPIPTNPEQPQTEQPPIDGTIPHTSPPGKGHTHCFSVVSRFYLQTDWTETPDYVMKKLREIGESMEWMKYPDDEYYGKYIWGELLCKGGLVIENADPNADDIIDDTATVTISKADLQKALTDGVTELNFNRVKINLHPLYKVKIKITP